MRYEESLRDFNETQKKLFEIKSDIKSNFVEYCRNKYPDGIRDIEEMFDCTIKTVSALQYINVYIDSWCSVLVIGTDSDELQCVVDYSGEWSEEEDASDLIYDINEKTRGFMKKLYDEFPYSETEYI